MTKKLACAAAVATALALCGCSTFSDVLDKKIDYKTESARTVPTLEIPPDLTAPARDNRYVVPETGKSSATYSGYEADRKDQTKTGSTAVLPQTDQMRIERAGTQRWLVVSDQSPEKLWPLVKDFWQENGFLVKTEVAEAGVMETDWAENRANIPQGGVRGLLGKLLDSVYSTAERDKFRTRMDRTPDGKGTEIYLSHRGMVEVYQSQRDDQTVWQPREPDPNLEAEFLRRLMVRLGAQEEKAKQLASIGVPERRAELAKAGGSEELKVFEPFDRAWRRVGLALDRVGFTVEDRDRQKGLYFVRYADTDVESSKDTGFLSKLMFWKDKTEKPEQKSAARAGQSR